MVQGLVQIVVALLTLLFLPASLPVFAQDQTVISCTDCIEVNPCGNGILEEALGEMCEDGNTASGDGCDSSCRLECEATVCFPSVCGDDIWTTDEECDQGAANSDAFGTRGETCRSDCRLAHCGDGIRDFGEHCDGTPGCPSTCFFPPPPPCMPPDGDVHFSICPDRDVPWTKTYGALEDDDYGIDVKVDAHGTVYVLTVEDRVTTLRQLDACGNLVWERPLFGGFGTALDLDACGNSYVSTKDISAWTDTLRLFKVSFSGLPLESTAFHVSPDAFLDDMIRDVAVDRDNESLYVTGARGPEEEADIWVRKYNLSLDLEEEVILSPPDGVPNLIDGANGIDVGPSGNIYVAGFIGLPEEASPLSRSQHFWLGKFDSNLDVIWTDDWSAIDPPDFWTSTVSAALSILVDESDNTHATSFAPTTDESDPMMTFLVTYDSAGNLIQEYTRPVLEDRWLTASGLDQDSDDRFVLAGRAVDRDSPFLEAFYFWSTAITTDSSVAWEDPLLVFFGGLGLRGSYLEVSVDDVNNAAHLVGIMVRNPDDATYDYHDAIIRKLLADGTDDGWRSP